MLKLRDKPGAATKQNLPILSPAPPIIINKRKQKHFPFNSMKMLNTLGNTFKNDTSHLETFGFK